ncbi:MAG: peptide chain release factor N(5)-glutamine methyltransferase [Acidobacteriaceae bacterium]|nr:peptide chain release factor N(5)-glutamine methyltransferase [Acidobacteriaceae bacterium]MBV9499640.1 peptide chain release factor N(5)-glutamine methyltransferase [Acidobacteriaceae bacterium]
MTLQTALLQGTEILYKAAIPVPRLTAEVLLCHALHCERAYLYAHATDELTQLAWIHYGRYLNQRLKGKPTQYITHRQEFFGRDFYVNTDVLIPRSETEHLVEAAMEFLKDRPDARVLDVGTGSGAIAISVALESRRTVLASDISWVALAVAERNRKAHAAQVRFFVGDLVEAIAANSIDLLISNPPYVPGADQANMQSEVRDWEPHIALFAGDSGFEIYQRLISGAESVIRPGGRLLMELGYQSLAGVQEILATRWNDIAVLSDLAGLPRVIGATLRS